MVIIWRWSKLDALFFLKSDIRLKFDTKSVECLGGSDLDMDLPKIVCGFFFSISSFV